MATSKELPFHERVQVKNNLERASVLVIFLLLISLLYYRLSSMHRHGLVWVAAFLCESWFTFIWLLNVNLKWKRVRYITYPERISKRVDDLPAVDMFLTTADPKLEPPMVTVNTVLSLMAVEYPAHKLACYVSDDACSAITCYALAEAAEFARAWVPFCKTYNLRVRAPFVYFSKGPESSHLLPSDFLRDWEVMKFNYEELGTRIDEAARSHHVPSSFLKGEVAGMSKFERGNHPTVVKVIWENKDSIADGIPQLIYVAREKRPIHPHHYKAGAMNVLTRVSGVMTNAPVMLNVDCDMFVNNPDVVLHAMCLLLGFPKEQMRGFVQCPQRFYGGPKDDPFGNQLVVLANLLGTGMEEHQGVIYEGTGCFHRRKIIYGEAPEIERNKETRLHEVKGKLLTQELHRRFGGSMELQDSAAEIISGVPNTISAIKDLTAREQAAKEVASCTYELNTCWGKEAGWAYGSTAEDAQTGLRIHSMGWKSIHLDPNPTAFLGTSAVGGPVCLTQYKRWCTGLLEILVGPWSPLVVTFTKTLGFRQCLAYLFLSTWGLRSIPELCYMLLAPFCAFSNTSFLPKASEPMAVIPVLLFIFYNAYTVMEYLECGLSVRAWWNNQRMERMRWTSASLFGLLCVVMKVLGMSETTFEVTSKEQSASTGAVKDPGRFTFDSSPLFISGTVIVLLNLAALVVSLLRVLGSPFGVNYRDGPGAGELVCSVWVVISYWPFVRGFFGRGSYGLPWPTIVKASILGTLFVLFCGWTA